MKKKPNPTDVHVGNRVRAARLTLGMSQEKLGGGLGLTFQQVQKYEKGTNRIGSSRLQAIAKLLQKPVGWFFEDAPGGPTSAQSTRDLGGELLALPGGAELARHFLAIAHGADRRVVVDVAKSLAAHAGVQLRKAG